MTAERTPPPRTIAGHSPADYEVEARAVIPLQDRWTVFPAESLDGTEPIFWDGALPPGEHLRRRFFLPRYFIPDIRLDRWRDATVAGAGQIFTATGKVLHGLVPVGGFAEQLLAPWTDLALSPGAARDEYVTAVLDEVETLDTAVVIARGAPGNYHHILTDILPRLHVLAAALANPDVLSAAPELRDAPILINAHSPEWAILMMEAVGVPRSRLRRIPDRGALRVKQLFVPHVLNDFAHWVSPELPRFYQPLYAWAKTQAPQARYGERIFSLRREMRGDRRRIHNQQQITNVLQARGFVEVRTGQMSWAEQIVAFTEARSIVAAMGSNVSNILFGRPGARTLVLHPEDSVYSLNVAMAAASGQEVGYLWADCFSNSARGEHVELFVPLDVLQKGLAAL